MFLNMGLGKTVITLTALSDLDAKRVLVLAPATVVEMDVWGEEGRKWVHLEYLDVEPIVGTAQQRLKKVMRLTSKLEMVVDVVSYDNVLWLTDALERDTYDAIVFDELSKMKHPGTQRFKRLRAWAREIPLRVGLTGTPVGNHLLDIWGEMFMVAGADPLGGTFTAFRSKYFAPTDFQMRNWELKHPTCEQEIIYRVKEHAFSLDPIEARTKMPGLRVNPIDIALPPEVAKMEADLASTCAVELANGAELTALSASALGMKVRQLSSGAVYHGVEGEWAEVHTAKLDRLEELLEEMQGEPVLLFYWFQHELLRLQKRFPWAKSINDKGALDAWNQRKAELLLAHPASAGHGLNLQAGGFNAWWYTLPWSLELWRQANGRLARLGQKSQVVVAQPLMAGEADWMVLAALKEKERVEARVMDEVRMREQFLGLEDIL